LPVSSTVFKHTALSQKHHQKPKEFRYWQYLRKSTIFSYDCSFCLTRQCSGNGWLCPQQSVAYATLSQTSFFRARSQILRICSQPGFQKNMVSLSLQISGMSGRKTATENRLPPFMISSSENW